MPKSIDVMSIAEVIVGLKQLRKDYSDSAEWCNGNGKPSGVKFNNRRVAEIDEMIATLKAAMK